MFDPEKPPELAVAKWLNAKEPLTLASLKGRVVLLSAFQMLCPMSLRHGLPQAKRFADRFDPSEVAVIGLHVPFKHRKAMGAEAVAAFAEEFGWTFPIGLDAANGEKRPKTMAAYEMRGTPTVLLFDRQGRLRRHYLGEIDDIRLAADAMALAIEDAAATREQSLAIEGALASALVDPNAHAHGHDHHHHDGCCGHDHGPGGRQH